MFGLDNFCSDKCCRSKLDHFGHSLISTRPLFANKIPLDPDQCGEQNGTIKCDFWTIFRYSNLNMRI